MLVPIKDKNKNRAFRGPGGGASLVVDLMKDNQIKDGTSPHSEQNPVVHFLLLFCAVVSKSYQRSGHTF